MVTAIYKAVARSPRSAWLRRLMEFLGDVPGVRANKFTDGRRGEEKFGEKHPHAIHTALILAILTHTRARALSDMYTHTHVRIRSLIGLGAEIDSAGKVGSGRESQAADLDGSRAIDSGIEETRRV